MTRGATDRIDLAVIVVTWNNADVISAALRSLLDDLHGSGLRHQVHVVDSNSSDNSAALVRRDFPRVKLLECADNRGFGAANNLALRRLGFGGAQDADTPAAVYLLNPDTITQPGACRRLYESLMASDDLGVVGAALSYADGSFQHSAFRFPGLRQLYCELFPAPGRWLEGAFNGRYSRARYQAAAPFDIDFPLGATMMLKREVIEQAGLFDEAFFLYCEEVDWAWRIRKLGWRIACEPRARVTHLGGQSTGQARPASLVHLWRSRLLLCKKQLPRWKRPVARWLIRLGMRRKLHALESESALANACREIIEMAQR